MSILSVGEGLYIWLLVYLFVIKKWRKFVENEESLKNQNDYDPYA